MEFRDYYQALGVARDAPADEIKKAYRKLARKYHPDVSKEADAGKRMAEVNEAYAVLSDPEKRAAYDQIGKGAQPGQEFRPPPGWDQGFHFSERAGPGGQGEDFSDFFSEIFGRARASRERNDQHARVMLDLEDSFTGATRQLMLGDRALNVKIPKGVREGQVIRLAGQGKPGDLLLEVQFREHPRYRVDGRDLLVALPIAPWEAALGAVVPVDLPDATLKVRIPAGAQSGRQMRVRGKGLPSNPPGDLYLDIRIVTPPADTPKAKEHYETMAKAFDFDPRAQ